jgi:superkiller protein 3
MRRATRLGLAVPALLAAGVAFAADKPPKSKSLHPQVEEPAPWETHPNELKLDLVRSLISEGDDAEALSMIAAMRQSGLTVPQLDLLQGIALRNQGVDSEAERLLLAAQKKMPRDAGPYRELCLLYADARKLDEAVASCHRATELSPTDAASWNNLGFLYLGLDRSADALAALQRATDIDSSQVRYRNNLGFAQAAAGRYEDALRTFQSTSSEAEARYNLGVAYNRAGRPEDAADNWRQALEADPDCAEARTALKDLLQSDPPSGEATPSAPATGVSP